MAQANALNAANVDHNLIVGTGSGYDAIAPSATSGVPLISQGASADPAFGTAVVAGGGTGSTSFNINGAVFSNTTSTGALQAATLSSGQLLIGGTTTPAAANLTAGTGISIMNGNNSITISSTATSSGQLVTASSSSLISGSTVLPYDDTIPQNDEGFEVITATITPESATSILQIIFNSYVFTATGGTIVSLALFQDSTADALAASVGATFNSDNNGSNCTLVYYMTSGTTSATTFKVRAGPQSSVALTFNGSGAARKFGGVSNTVLSIREILS